MRPHTVTIRQSSKRRVARPINLSPDRRSGALNHCRLARWLRRPRLGRGDSPPLSAVCCASRAEQDIHHLITGDLRRLPYRRATEDVRSLQSVRQPIINAPKQCLFLFSAYAPLIALLIGETRRSRPKLARTRLGDIYDDGIG